MSEQHSDSDPSIKVMLVGSTQLPGKKFLEHCIEPIGKFLHGTRALFIPSFFEPGSQHNSNTVRETLARSGMNIYCHSDMETLKNWLEEAPAILIGGDDPFRVYMGLHQYELDGLIHNRIVHDHIPCVFWGGATEIAGKSLTYSLKVNEQERREIAGTGNKGVPTSHVIGGLGILQHQHIVLYSPQFSAVQSSLISQLYNQYPDSDDKNMLLKLPADGIYHTLEKDGFVNITPWPGDHPVLIPTDELLLSNQ